MQLHWEDMTHMEDRTKITFRDGKVMEGIEAYTVPQAESSHGDVVTLGLNESRVITFSIETNLQPIMARMRIAQHRNAQKGACSGWRRVAFPS
jgi:hypothetical protein